MSTNVSAKYLQRAVLARRAELDMTQLEVHHRGGPSNTTLTKIENGELETLTRQTARRLDTGLGWEPGSARRVWAGGQPVTVGSIGGDEREELRRRVLAAGFLTDEQKAKMLAALTQQQPSTPPPQPPSNEGVRAG